MPTVAGRSLQRELQARKLGARARKPGISLSSSGSRSQLGGRQLGWQCTKNADGGSGPGRLRAASRPPGLSCCPLAGQLRITLDSVSARCRSLLSGHIAGMAEPPRAPRHRAQPPARIQGTCCLQAARGSAKERAAIGAPAVGSSPCAATHSSGRARGLSRTAAPRAPRLPQNYEGPVGVWLGLAVQPPHWDAVPKGQGGGGLAPPGPTRGLGSPSPSHHSKGGAGCCDKDPALPRAGNSHFFGKGGHQPNCSKPAISPRNFGF